MKTLDPREGVSLDHRDLISRICKGTHLLRSRNGQKGSGRVSFSDFCYTRPRYQGEIVHATQCAILSVL